MHIVHVIARLNDGGPARVLISLGRELAARGHRCTVLAGSTAADEPDIDDRLRAAGMAVETVPGLGRRISLFDDARAFMHLRRRLAALAPDLVHTHTAKAGVLGRLAARSLGLRCLHTYHGHVLSGYFAPLANLAVRWLERLLAHGCHLHALTPTLLVELRDRFRIGRTDRWHCLPVPVEPVGKQSAAWQRELAPGRPVIGLLGRLAPVKDGRLYLDTLAELARRLPVQGLICGDGGERAPLEAYARTLAVPVRFTGFVPAGEALAAMDVLLITSRNEGLPLAAVEAGSAGVPVVAAAVGGLRDLARWGAVQTASRDAAVLAEACARVLGDAVARQRLLDGGAALAQRLRPDALASRYAALYAGISRPACGR